MVHQVGIVNFKFSIAMILSGIDHKLSISSDVDM